MKYLLIIAIIIGIILLFWARFISTSGLTVKEYTINSLKLKEFDGLKIVQFTDLHYGSTIHIKDLKNLIETINNQNPDVIVFTGDLVENQVVLTEKEVNDVIEEFKKLNSKYTTLAIKGNHDYDHTYFEDITSKLNWNVLKNKYEYFYYNNSETPIVFVGLDDLLYGELDYKGAFSFNKEKDTDLYTIVLAHEPDQVDEFLDYDFDLVISGHSHLGQVRAPLIGAIYTPIGSKKYYEEHYKIKDADLYINGGIGTSGLKLRFLNKPSISIYTFKTR